MNEELLRELAADTDKAAEHKCPISAADVERLNVVVKKHEKLIHTFGYGTVVDRYLAVLKHYEQCAINTVNSQKSQRDDEIVFLRALSMILEMVGNAGTHKEKAARLRGCIEMIETGIQKLREQTFEVSRAWRYHPDLFRSDFPVRQYMDRIRDLEYELKQAKEKKPDPDLVQTIEEEDRATDPPF